MRKIYCDLCNEEIKEEMQEIKGSFNSKEGLLVSVTVSSPAAADICKNCVIDIIQNGNIVNCMERKYKSDVTLP